MFAWPKFTTYLINRAKLCSVINKFAPSIRNVRRVVCSARLSFQDIIPDKPEQAVGLRRLRLKRIAIHFSTEIQTSLETAIAREDGVRNL